MKIIVSMAFLMLSSILICLLYDISIDLKLHPENLKILLTIVVTIITAILSPFAKEFIARDSKKIIQKFKKTEVIENE